MSEILINYEQVYAEIANIRSAIQNDLIPRVASDYKELQSNFDSSSDGAHNARIKAGMEEQKRKTMEMIDLVDRLASFMENSSREFERNEKEMAVAIVASASSESSSVKGGVE